MRQKLGQHFLKNEEVLEKEVVALELKDGEAVIEIGPGQGALTKKLLTSNSKKIKIVAVEKDSKLANALKENFSEDKNLEIIEGDILKVLPEITSKLKFGSYKIIGNIPYYLTGFLLRTIGELVNKPEVCVFIIQKEVAERIVAEPPRMNKLAASVHFWANPEILRFVSRKDFSPPPEVESALIKLKIKSEKLKAEEEKYYKAVNILFQQPRKTILNNLVDAEQHADRFGTRSNTRINAKERLEKIGIRPEGRPQDLGIKEIVEIADKFGF